MPRAPAAHPCYNNISACARGVYTGARLHTFEGARSGPRTMHAAAMAIANKACMCARAAAMSKPHAAHVIDCYL